MYIGQRAWESDTDEGRISTWNFDGTWPCLLPRGSHPVAVVQYTFSHKQYTEQQLTNWEKFRPCHIFASYTLAFASQLRKKHRKTSVRVVTKYSV